MRRLIIRPGGIGDCILCFPAIEHLRAAFTEVWVPRSVVPLVRFADRVRAISSTGLDLFGVPGVDPPPAVLAALRDFDEIVSWYGANRPEFREALTTLGVPVRFLPALPPADSSEHAADFFARHAGAPFPAVPSIACDATSNDAIWLHPFSGGGRKNWPFDRFRKLAGQLTAYAPVEWAETHGGVRFEDLYELARRLAGARLYIGNDSGITHVAAAVGARVIALFGETNPDVWGPRGANVRVIQAETLDRISVEDVLRASLEQSGC